MRSPFLCSRCDGDGEHSCSYPPRCQDVVLDSLRRLESCRIRRSFSTARYVARRWGLGASPSAIGTRIVPHQGERRQTSAATGRVATGRAEWAADLSGDGELRREGLIGHLSLRCHLCADLDSSCQSRLAILLMKENCKITCSVMRWRVPVLAHGRWCCTNMQEGGDFAHGRRFCTDM